MKHLSGILNLPLHVTSPALKPLRRSGHYSLTVHFARAIIPGQRCADLARNPYGVPLRRLRPHRHGRHIAVTGCRELSRFAMRRNRRDGGPA
jgi:hypothetical protein